MKEKTYKYIAVFKEKEHTNINCFYSWEDLVLEIPNVSSRYYDVYKDALISQNSEYRRIDFKGTEVTFIAPSHFVLRGNYSHSSKLIPLDYVEKELFDKIPLDKFDIHEDHVLDKSAKFGVRNVGTLFNPSFKKVEIKKATYKPRKLISNDIIISEGKKIEASITRRYNLYAYM